MANRITKMAKSSAEGVRSSYFIWEFSVLVVEWH